MHPRALDIIQRLDLQPHPEGGRYRRVFASRRRVLRAGTGEQRLALTSIVYLLTAGEPWAADDPLVRERPHLFSAEPPAPNFPRRSAPAVEQATSAPGERRGGRRA